MESRCKLFHPCLPFSFIRPSVRLFVVSPVRPFVRLSLSPFVCPPTGARLIAGMVDFGQSRSIALLSVRISIAIHQIFALATQI